MADGSNIWVFCGRQFPSAFFIYRTGGNEIIKANLGKKHTLNHKERQSYWAKQINTYMDTVVTNSKYTEDRLSLMGIKPSRFYRCVGGVDVAVTNFEGTKNDVVTFLLRARFVPYKNHELLLNAFTKLSHLNFKLLLAGDGILLNEMRTLTHKLGLDTKVLFLDRLGNADVVQTNVIQRLLFTSE